MIIAESAPVLPPAREGAYAAHAILLKSMNFSVEHPEASYTFSCGFYGKSKTFETFDMKGLAGFDFVGPDIGVSAVSQRLAAPFVFEGVHVG